MKQLVSTDWLSQNLNKVKILDATWHLPNSGKDAENDFNLSHIKNSLFFDIDKNSNQNSDLPHMLPGVDEWERIVSNLGISNSDHIIIYDNSDIFSSCRVWYSFIFFGHDTNHVSVLDGNFEKWKNEDKLITSEKILVNKTNYKAKTNSSLVINKDQVKKNILNKKFQLIDARNKERFQGIQAEPRKGLRSGNIEGSKNLPFQLLINKDRTFKKKDEISNIFKKNEIDLDKDIAFTCGSGVTACVLGMANSLINDKTPIIYDGSWSEYGQIKNENK
ncbi:MAG: sulfurtransferase [Candidatus Pelagibacter sp.]|nr:sulfurtransferase [Candidatus Pelagibacter sp.]|tara:strand:- start:1185 stop:2012 length:828 start_codon:yes stop_codon:yes gene_type:complete